MVKAEITDRLRWKMIDFNLPLGFQFRMSDRAIGHTTRRLCGPREDAYASDIAIETSRHLIFKILVV